MGGDRVVGGDVGHVLGAEDSDAPPDGQRHQPANDNLARVAASRQTSAKRSSLTDSPRRRAGRCVG